MSGKIRLLGGDEGPSLGSIMRAKGRRGGSPRDSDIVIGSLRSCSRLFRFSAATVGGSELGRGNFLGRPPRHREQYPTGFSKRLRRASNVKQDCLFSLRAIEALRSSSEIKLKLPGPLARQLRRIKGNFTIYILVLLLKYKSVNKLPERKYRLLLVV